MLLYSNLASFELCVKSRLLTLVIATKNSVKCLPQLLQGLYQQDANLMEILFIDSSDDPQATLNILLDLPLPFRFFHGRDFSIYDALNIGLTHLQTEYYSVCGSDDIIFENYSRSIATCVKGSFVDIAVFPVMISRERVFAPTLRNQWLNCTDIPHAVGVVVKSSLHKRHGSYSSRYPICADKHFLAKCIAGGASVYLSDHPIGCYGQAGKSSREVRHYLLDLFNIQVDLGRNYFLQLFLLLFRLLRYSKVCGRALG